MMILNKSKTGVQMKQITYIDMLNADAIFNSDCIGLILWKIAINKMWFSLIFNFHNEIATHNKDFIIRESMYIVNTFSVIGILTNWRTDAEIEMHNFYHWT